MDMFLTSNQADIIDQTAYSVNFDFDLQSSQKQRKSYLILWLYEQSSLKWEFESESVPLADLHVKGAVYFYVNCYTNYFCGSIITKWCLTWYMYQEDSFNPFLPNHCSSLCKTEGSKPY